MNYIDPENKLMWHLDRVQGLRLDERQPPVNVEIDLSNRCSLGCRWCHFAYTHTRGPARGKQDKPIDAIPGGDLMDGNLARKIIHDLCEYGVRSITWTGGGEPTLHPDFDGIIEYAYYKGIDQGIYTHGGHIDEQRAALMKKVMTWVYVSLDASNKFYYSEFKRVPESRFDAACDGAKRLMAADGDAVVGLGFMINKDNYLRAPRMVSLAKGLKVDYCQFRPAIMFHSNEPGQAAEERNWSLAAYDYLHRWKDSSFVKVELDRFLMYGHWRGHGYPTCWWSGIQTVITPNGKVWTCVNKREYPGEELGDLTKKNFKDIWESSSLAPVNENCRVLCRGHVGNLALERMNTKPVHENFI